MNQTLQLEIIKHIYSLFGIDCQTKMIDNRIVFSQEKLLQNKLKYEEDGVNYEQPCWAAELEIAPNTIQCSVVQLGSSEVGEFALALRMDSVVQYGLRLSSDLQDSGSFLTNVAGKWQPTSVYTQACLLAGLEHIASMPVMWKRVDDYMTVYNQLIHFLQNMEE